LVEHDLAKVGVASSNLVFRSNPFLKKGFIVKRLNPDAISGRFLKSPAQMVELVDTQDLKSCSRKRSAGSIPALSTNPDAGASGFCVKMSTYTNAKVAQLVEHDLAKVGVASSNLVFRSESFPYLEGIFLFFWDFVLSHEIHSWRACVDVLSMR
jgi:hypothetical protein